MPHAHPFRLALVLALAISLQCASAPATEYSKEAAVVENMATSVRFSGDGTREWRQVLSVRLQSEAAVRQFGVLAFSYSSLSEQVTVDYVRVKKLDGSTVETPASSIQDVAAGVERTAPTYFDVRQKQIPVKALGVGDLLEYSVRTVQSKPEVPGQFWFSQPFINDGVVLNQTLEIEVPRDKYVQVTSPDLKPEVHDGAATRVYTWKYAHLEPSKPNEKKGDEAKSPKVQITTFKNWEEVGSWWANLANPESEPSPAIVAKARELTAGLSSNLEKEKAIYRYVATKYRYISVSLGLGRYRPHSADEVLGNQFGDCKDKHTLFVSLLRAAGIEAWPALIGAGIKFDRDVPTPAQFNHVITVIPEESRYIWLDTTAEVAPFGFLNAAIRDETALVIPSFGPQRKSPFLLKTPVDPPFESSQLISVNGSLSADGVLTARFAIETVGDVALDLRSGFRQLAPTQWQALAQQLSYAMNYSGDVSGVELENLEDTDKPFRLSYDYKRKDYPGWKESNINPPLPPLAFGPGSEAEKPKEPVWVGASGQVLYRFTIKLPVGFTATLPQGANVSDKFATYSSRYSFKDGALEAERKLVIKQPKIAAEVWPAYQKFAKGLQDDQAISIALAKSSGGDKPVTAVNNPEAQRLLEQAGQSLQAQDLNQVRDLLLRAERLNPKQAKLWIMRSYLEMRAGNNEEAVSDARKEIENHPEETFAYQLLSEFLLHADRRGEAIEVLKKDLASNPSDTTAALKLASLLIAGKQYSDLLGMIEKPIAAAPDNYALQVLKVGALLGTGKKEEGIQEARRVAKDANVPDIWNDLAYRLAENNTALDLAFELANKAVVQLEQDCAATDLGSLDTKSLRAVDKLASAWDTLGWIYFKQGDLGKAQKHIEAAWQLNQHAEAANHLGEIYERQGQHEAAIHLWRLALAVNSKYEIPREHLRKAGVPVSEPPRGKVAPKDQPASPAEELGRLRTVKLPTLAKQTGTAEFYLLASRDRVEDVQFISGDDRLKSAGEAIRHADGQFAFPDEGPEKIVRRGILSCSEYTKPSCSLTFLLPSTVRLDAIVRRAN